MNTLKKIALLFLVGFLIYLPSFWNQFVWDDEQFIYKNEYVMTADVQKIFTTNTIAGAGHQSDYYRPLTTLSFAIDHGIWGLKPFGFHLTNTLLHIFAGIILFLFLKELTIEKKDRVAFFISLLFLIHPIQTEAVVYANSRGDSLFTLFAFLSLYTLALSFRQKKIKFHIYDQTLQLGKVGLLFSSSFFYILSIFSKEIGIVTVGLQFLVVFVSIIHNHKSDFKKFVGHYIYLVGQIIIAGGYLWLRATVLNFQHSFNLYGTENVYTSSLVVRLFTFSKIVWTYFRLLLIPFPLYMERSSQVITTFLNPFTIGLVLLLVLITGLAFLEWKQTKTVWILFSTAWFFGGLAPTSGIIPINGLIYEHWLYVPMVGFFLFWFSLFKLFKPHPKIPPKITISLLSIISVILILLTIRQNYFWSSPIRLYEYLLQYTESARIHNNLAMAYSEVDRHRDAIQEYKKAIELADIYPQTHHNLGNTYRQLNQLDQAEQEFKKAIEMNPNFFISYPYLIELYIKQTKYETALELADTLIERSPNQIDWYLIRGQILIKLDQPEEANQSFAKALELSDNSFKVQKIINQLRK